MSEQAEKFYSEWYTNESAEQMEKPKREFIVTLDLANADIEWSIPIANTEEIVRCKDCRHFKPGEEQPPVDWCEYFNDEVEPLGFCAWGESRGDWITCKCGEELEAPSGRAVCPSCGRTVVAE